MGLLGNFSEEETEEQATPECGGLGLLTTFTELNKSHQLCLCEWEMFEKDSSHVWM